MNDQHRLTRSAPEILGTVAAPLTSDPEFEIPIDRESPRSNFAVCDLAEGYAFFPSLTTPPVPVLSAFGAGRLHAYRVEGSWDLDRAVEEMSHRLVRSFRLRRADHDAPKWKDLIFQFATRSYLCVDHNWLIGYATTHLEAERLCAQFSQLYGRIPPPAGGSFRLIKVTQNDIRTVTVALEASAVLSDETFRLHYGDGAAAWHQAFTEKLRTLQSGVSILEGPPGTGKTWYLRHLMGSLDQSHRFYFIPTASMGILSKPEFIDFWSNERRNHCDRKFVVILEDADAVLLTRAADNREEVSAILNLSDGMLSDFLHLQIICTVNCALTDLDPALLRPGRLLSHRLFARLGHPQAARLGANLGKTLPAARDYSLAEVFASGGNLKAVEKPRVGFAA